MFCFFALDGSCYSSLRRTLACLYLSHKCQVFYHLRDESISSGWWEQHFSVDCYIVATVTDNQYGTHCTCMSLLCVEWLTCDVTVVIPVGTSLHVVWVKDHKLEIAHWHLQLMKIKNKHSAMDVFKMHFLNSNIKDPSLLHFLIIWTIHPRKCAGERGLGAIQNNFSFLYYASHGVTRLPAISADYLAGIPVRVLLLWMRHRDPDSSWPTSFSQFAEGWHVAVTQLFGYLSRCITSTWVKVVLCKVLSEKSVRSVTIINNAILLSRSSVARVWQS